MLFTGTTGDPARPVGENIMIPVAYRTLSLIGACLATLCITVAASAPVIAAPALLA